MSSLKRSSSVLTDHETRASGNVFIKSTSRKTKSDFVAMESRAPMPCNCSRSVRVRLYAFSAG